MQMRKNTLLLRRASYVDITSLSRGREVSIDWVFPFTITLLVVVNKCNAVDFGLLRHREYTRHIFTDELVLKKTENFPFILDTKFVPKVQILHEK